MDEITGNADNATRQQSENIPSIEKERQRQNRTEDEEEKRKE